LDGEITYRDIEPIITYTCDLGYTLIVAYCRLRQDYRTFRLDGIKNSLLLSKRFNSKNHAKTAVLRLMIMLPSNIEMDTSAIADVLNEKNIRIMSI